MEFEIEDLGINGTVADKCNEVDGYTSHGLIKVNPSNCVLPTKFKDFIPEIKNFPVRQDDVFLITNPKCGTTWSQEMVWLVANDCDFEGAKRDLNDRFPYIDIQGCIKHADDVLAKVAELPSPRFFKSHLPKALLPNEMFTKDCKIIFVLRDARDAAISNFHHYQTFHGYDGTLDEFLIHTLNERVVYSPFWEHAIEFWEMRNNANVLFIRYEEMKQDLAAVLHRIAKFFGKSLTEEQIEKLKDHLNIEKMRDNPAVNFEETRKWVAERNKRVTDGRFIREGKSGGWKKNFSPEMVEKFRKWTEQKISGTGLEQFNYL